MAVWIGGVRLPESGFAFGDPKSEAQVGSPMLLLGTDGGGIVRHARRCGGQGRLLAARRCVERRAWHGGGACVTPRCFAGRRRIRRRGIMQRAWPAPDGGDSVRRSSFEVLLGARPRGFKKDGILARSGSYGVLAKTSYTAQPVPPQTAPHEDMNAFGIELVFHC